MFQNWYDFFRASSGVLAGFCDREKTSIAAFKSFMDIVLMGVDRFDRRLVSSWAASVLFSSLFSWCFFLCLLRFFELGMRLC